MVRPARLTMSPATATEPPATSTSSAARKSSGRASPAARPRSSSFEMPSPRGFEWWKLSISRRSAPTQSARLAADATTNGCWLTTRSAPVCSSLAAVSRTSASSQPARATICASSSPPDDAVAMAARISSRFPRSTVERYGSTWLSRWRWRDASALNTAPPPMVTTGENCRRIKRSPGSTSTGSSRRSWANTVAPGESSSRSSRITSATVSAVP